MCTLKNRVCSPFATLRRLAIAAAMGVLCTLAIANPPCPSDLDGDGMVTGADISLVLLDFGACPVDPPSISSITPNYGPTAGGTTITITGTALTDASAVTVRGKAATSVTVVNDTTVTAVTPAGSVGAANVQVTTPGGTATISGAFTYGNAPPPPVWCTVLEQSPNATVVPDATLRAAITATNLPWRVRDTGTGIEMVLIPPGTYTMGCSASNGSNCNSDETQHQVTLTNAFYMGKTEVTQAQWLAEMGSNPSQFTGDPQRPVDRVSWTMIQPFLTQNGLRLPTEAEWEYACRAGTTTARYGVLNDISWNNSNSGLVTHTVATKLPNALGLYDTIGNVFEWVADWWGNGVYSAAAVTNPTGPNGEFYRVFRGGSYGNFGPQSCRGSWRSNLYLEQAFNDDGFRVARTP